MDPLTILLGDDFVIKYGDVISYIAYFIPPVLSLILFGRLKRKLVWMAVPITIFVLRGCFSLGKRLDAQLWGTQRAATALFDPANRRYDAALTACVIWREKAAIRGNAVLIVG